MPSGIVSEVKFENKTVSRTTFVISVQILCKNQTVTNWRWPLPSWNLSKIKSKGKLFISGTSFPVSANLYADKCNSNWFIVVKHNLQEPCNGRENRMMPLYSDIVHCVVKRNERSRKFTKSLYLHIHTEAASKLILTTLYTVRDKSGHSHMHTFCC